MVDFTPAAACEQPVSIVQCPSCLNENIPCSGTGLIHAESGHQRYKYTCKCGFSFQQLPERIVSLYGKQLIYGNIVSHKKPITCRRCGQIKKNHTCKNPKTAHKVKKSRPFVSHRKNNAQRCGVCHQTGHKMGTCKMKEQSVQPKRSQRTYHFDSVPTEPEEFTLPLAPSSGLPQPDTSKICESPNDITSMLTSQFESNPNLELQELLSTDIQSSIEEFLNEKCSSCSTTIGVLTCKCKTRALCIECNDGSLTVNCP